METATTNFTYSFTTSKKPQEVYQILLDIPQWWSGLYEETINGESKKINDEFTFKAGGGAHYTKQKLIELIPNKKIVWLVTDSNLTFINDPGEWKDTKISFDILIEDNKTKVVFTHEGLVPEIECYKNCSNGWTGYLDKLAEIIFHFRHQSAQFKCKLGVTFPIHAWQFNKGFLCFIKVTYLTVKYQTILSTL